MFSTTILTIQFFTIIVEVHSNLLQPEFSVKILNSENIILSIGDLNMDNNKDLEIIQNVSENPELKKKLGNFHKYIGLLQADHDKETNRPAENLFNNNHMANKVMPYQDLLRDIENKLYRSKNLKNNKKKFLRRFKNRKHFWKNRWAMQKREIAIPNYEEKDKEADYLEKEYEEFVLQTRKNGTSYKYTDEGKPEESFKDVVQKLTDFKTPKNCTNVTGIGIQAMECLVKNIGSKDIGKRQMLENFSWILLMWLCLYLVVAIPLWCSRGWCCCCCRCAICFPTKTVRKIQQYIAENPPGTYVNSKGEVKHYNPNIKEIEIYEKIKKSIAEF